MRQTRFEKTDWNHRFSYGGTLRKKRRGRSERPLSTKEPIHLVLKGNQELIRGGLRIPRRFTTVHRLADKYSKRFAIKIEQMSLQFDHIHMVVRISGRSNFQNFLRVFAGQIAQVFGVERLRKQSVKCTARGVSRDTAGARRDKSDARRDKAPNARGDVTDTPRTATKLWKHRPFTRVVRGYRAYLVVKNYVQLNEQEAIGRMAYRKNRLRGLKPEEWESLWS